MIGMSAGVRMDALYAITYSEKISKKKQYYDESLEGDLLKAHVLYRFMTE